MKTLIAIGIMIIVLMAGIHGNLGSILASIIDPASLVEGTRPNTIIPTTIGPSGEG